MDNSVGRNLIESFYALLGALELSKETGFVCVFGVAGSEAHISHSGVVQTDFVVAFGGYRECECYSTLALEGESFKVSCFGHS